jgi:hypothetical protein
MVVCERVGVVAVVSLLCGSSNVGGGSGSQSCAEAIKYDGTVEAVALLSVADTWM